MQDPAASDAPGCDQVLVGCRIVRDLGVLIEPAEDHRRCGADQIARAGSHALGAHRIRAPGRLVVVRNQELVLCRVVGDRRMAFPQPRGGNEHRGAQWSARRRHTLGFDIRAASRGVLRPGHHEFVRRRRIGHARVRLRMLGYTVLADDERICHHRHAAAAVTDEASDNGGRGPLFDPRDQARVGPVAAGHTHGAGLRARAVDVDRCGGSQRRAVGRDETCAEVDDTPRHEVGVVRAIVRHAGETLGCGDIGDGDRGSEPCFLTKGIKGVHPEDDRDE